MYRSLILLTLIVPLVGLAFAAPALGAAPSNTGATISLPAVQRTPLVAGSLRNLTRDSIVQLNPAISVDGAGEIVTAWAQNVVTNGVTQRDIFTTASTDGVSFSLPVNRSRSPTFSDQPFLFPVNGTGTQLLYLDAYASTGNYQIRTMTEVSGTWSSPLALTTYRTLNYLTPMGVQASDGKVWFVAQVFTGGTATDTWAQQVGGLGYNLSNDGSAVRYPSITAGDNGQVYVAWVDHANEHGHPKPGINVMQWNGTGWVSLPVPSGETDITFASIYYLNGKLYLDWPSDTNYVGIKQRIWDGTRWGPTAFLAPGYRITYLRNRVTPAGDVFLTFILNGQAYIQRNSEPPVRVSGNLTGAKQLASYVTDNGVAYIVFSQNSNIWFTTAQ